MRIVFDHSRSGGVTGWEFVRVIDMEDAQSPRWLGELTMPPVTTWQSVRHAHAILQRRGGVGGDTQLELCRPGVGLGPLV